MKDTVWNHLLPMFQGLSFFQSLKLEMLEKDIEVSKLNEDANDMLSKAPSGSLQELARSLMRMNTLWTHVYQQVEHYSGLFSTSDQNWKQFKGILFSVMIIFFVIFASFARESFLKETIYVLMKKQLS